MPIEDVFSISGRGTVVTGRIEAGIVNVGDELEIVGIKDTDKQFKAAEKLKNKLGGLREIGLSTGGEYSNENLIQVNSYP